MGNQGYRSNYIAAFEGANHQLESIYAEYHELQRRKEKLEEALSALEPFLQSASSFSHEMRIPEPVMRQPEPVYSEPVYAAPAYTDQYSAPEPVVEPVILADKFAEPVAPAVFAADESSMDPLQLRINRALGLAVA
ncbi:MAG: hypothetical protein JST28_11430 [Acidobacteria bacterium]|nr:hypothetical protein [Acidobacteriota bacterium]